jgi:catechol 2,3-dioxygenase-like lactoylglutathione lyase family enzyme
MTYKIEVLILPVSDVERALAFYSEHAGFKLDVDYRPSDDFRVVQLTPPGSACSIQIGVGIRHKTPRGDWHGGWEPGLDPDRADYASFADFTDPDGNQWVLQERGFGDQPSSAGA